MRFLPKGTRPRRRLGSGLSRTKCRYYLGISLTIIFCFPASCSRTSTLSGKRPNIIVVLIDALRADSLQDYGSARSTDPFLAEFGTKGIRFTNAHSHSSLTKVSVASLFTGLLPPAHGVRNASLIMNKSKRKVISDVLAPGLTTVAEILRGENYATAAVVNNPHLDLSSGFSQGFQDYSYFPDPLIRAEAINKAALGWLAKTRHQPFFLYLHYMDIHTPYDPPPAYQRLYSEEKPFPPINKNGRWPGPISAEEVEYTRAVYDAQINYWDDCFRAFVDRLGKGGWLNDTLFIILADHGEEFYDHAGFGHGHTVYEEMLRVPLYLICPGRIPASQTRQDFVQLIDIFPTVCGIIGADVKKLSLPGWDLLDRKKRLPVSQRVHYAETCRGGVPRSIQSDGFKLIFNSRRHTYEFYDLSRDALEQKDIWDERLSALEAAKLKMKGMLSLYESGFRAPTKELEPKTVELLKSLGYIK